MNYHCWLLDCGIRYTRWLGGGSRFLHRRGLRCGDSGGCGLCCRRQRWTSRLRTDLRRSHLGATCGVSRGAGANSTRLGRCSVLGGLLTNGTLLFFVFGKNGHKIVRNGFIELIQRSTRLVSKKSKINGRILTLKSRLNLTSSAMRLSISLLTSACLFCVRRCFSLVTKSRNAGRGSAGGYKENAC